MSNSDRGQSVFTRGQAPYQHRPVQPPRLSPYWDGVASCFLVAFPAGVVFALLVLKLFLGHWPM